MHCCLNFNISMFKLGECVSAHSCLLWFCVVPLMTSQWYSSEWPILRHMTPTTTTFKTTPNCEPKLVTTSFSNQGRQDRPIFHQRQDRSLSRGNNTHYSKYIFFSLFLDAIALIPSTKSAPIISLFYICIASNTFGQVNKEPKIYKPT